MSRFQQDGIDGPSTARDGTVDPAEGIDDDTADDEEDQKQHTLRLATTIANKSEIFCLAFSEDGRFLVAGCGDGFIRVFNPTTGTIISVLVWKRGRKSAGGRREEGVGSGKGSDGGGRTKWSKETRDAERRASAFLGSVQLPCTCAVFRPHVKSRERTSGVALFGYSRGEIQLWHVPSAKLLYRQCVPAGIGRTLGKHGEEGDTEGQGTRGSHPSSEYSRDDIPAYDGIVSDFDAVEVLCCAYSGDGQFYAVGASDGIIRVNSDDTKELVAELKPGAGRGSGHSSRIFSVKFHPDDPNTLVSGGWDNCVHVWDIAKACTVRTVFGPHICGDAVDVMGTTILTGSWRDESQLQMWDINSGQASGPSFWSGHGKGALLQQGLGRRCRLYAAAFGGPAESPGRFVAAGGGAGANEVKVFDFCEENRLIGSLLGLSAGAISLAFEPGGKRLAVGLADGQVHLVHIEATAIRNASTDTGKTIMVF